MAHPLVPKELQDACDAVVKALRDKPGAVAQAAVTYAFAMDLAAQDYGEQGVQTQCLYILTNLGGWRGSEARATKEILKKYAKEPK